MKIMSKLNPTSKKHLFSVSVLILCFSGLVQAQSPEFIIMTSDGTNANNLYRMPLGSTQPVNIGPLTWSGIIWELTSGPNALLYGVDRTTETLVTIDPNHGSIISSVALTANIWNNRRGLSTAPDGTLYGIFEGWNLRTINPSTGQTTHVANITGISGGVESMAFADDGTLYAAASSSGNPYGEDLYTLNINTGQMNWIAQIGSSYIDIDTLTYAPDGFLYGVDTLSVDGTDLYKIDPSNGNRTFVVQLPGGVNGLHATPEPATMGMLAIGGMVMLRRKRG